MNTTVPITPASLARPLPVVEFGRSADDLLVARVGDTAFAMVPTRAGRHFLATGWRLSRPLDTWRRDDLGCVDDRLSDSESICRCAAFLRRNRRHTRGRTCGVDYRFVHFS